MSYEQVRGVLEAVRAFHRELGATCARLSHESSDERLQLLMNIVRQNERRFVKALRRYEKEAAEAVLNTWLQYTPTEQVRNALKTARLAKANSLAEIARVVWEFEEALIDLYHQLAESTAAPRVRELFEGLAELERAQRGQFAWSLDEFQESPFDSPETGD